jgi:hypothetical protein
VRLVGKLAAGSAEGNAKSRLYRKSSKGQGEGWYGGYRLCKEKVN